MENDLKKRYIYLVNTEGAVDIEKYGWTRIKLTPERDGNIKPMSNNDIPSCVLSFKTRLRKWLVKLGISKTKELKFIPNNLYTNGTEVVMCISDRVFGMYGERFGCFHGIKVIGDFNDDEIFRCSDYYVKSDFKPTSKEELIESGKYYQIGSRYKDMHNNNIVEITDVNTCGFITYIYYKIVGSSNKSLIGCSDYCHGGLELGGYVMKSRKSQKVAEPFSIGDIFMSQRLGIIVTPTAHSGILNSTFNAVVTRVFSDNASQLGYNEGSFLPKCNKKEFIKMSHDEFEIIEKFKPKS